MICTLVYVDYKNAFAKDAAEEINQLANSAGYSAAFNEKELYSCIRFFENEINGCDPYIAKILEIKTEQKELLATRF